MILFKMVDTAVLQSDWYREERGLKAEIVTYAIALLRHSLIEEGKDINLSTIFNNQRASESLLDCIVSLARTVREKIMDPVFTNGVTNPSEFCKSEKGWDKIKGIEVGHAALAAGDVLTTEQIEAAEEERKDINEAGATISSFEFVQSITPEEWDLIAEFHSGTYPPSHANVKIPRACANLHRFGKVPSIKDLDQAKMIRDLAVGEGFEYVS